MNLFSERISLSFILLSKTDNSASKYTNMQAEQVNELGEST